MSGRELKGKVFRALSGYCKTIDEIQIDIGKKYTQKEIAACLDALVKDSQVIRYKVHFYSIKKI
jgi:hypothetical protein